MTQFPRLTLRIRLLEMLVKGKVREVLQAGGIVSHHIVRPQEVLDEVAVLLLPLKEAGVVAEVRSQAILGDDTLGLTGDGRSIVAAVQHRGVGNVVGR